MRKALVLLSGGLDSATCAAIAASQGFKIYAISFGYGQRHSIELSFAKKIATMCNVVEHRIVELDPKCFAGSSLTDATEVPKDRDPVALEGIPSTYVPARNLIFLSFALGMAEVLGARDIFIGVNAIDYSGYPDCRPEFIESFEKTANLATKAGVEGDGFKIHTPLAGLSKSEIIKIGTGLGVDYSKTHSCYDPDDAGRSCGRCDSCILRRKGFEGAGIEDPTVYSL